MEAMGFCGSRIADPCMRRAGTVQSRASYSPSPLFQSMATRKQPAARTVAVRKISAVRRRSYFQSDTYVFMEPGKGEEFISEEELRIRLKDWLQNWPGNALPPDLARFETVDDAVSHLVKSVCELEVDGEVGSIQWYQVRLER